MFNNTALVLIMLSQITEKIKHFEKYQKYTWNHFFFLEKITISFKKAQTFSEPSSQFFDSTD